MKKNNQWNQKLLTGHPNLLYVFFGTKNQEAVFS